MARVKGGTRGARRRKAIIRQTKGYRHGRSTKKRQAREAIFHAGKHAFAHRRDRKNDFRKLWTTRLNAALRERGTNYSRFIHALKIRNIALNRKMLAALAAEHPEIFAKLADSLR